MSSFLLSSKHFNSVQKALVEMIRGNHLHLYPLKDKFPDIYNKNSKYTIEVINSVIDTVRELSVTCFHLQYANHYPENLNTEIEIHRKYLLNHKTGFKQLTPLGLYNAVRCISYQIEPEHLEELRPLTGPEADALFFLDEISKALATFIIQNLPEDETCSWSIE